MRAFLLTALLLAPLAQAETYKWVDAKGVVNYSNTPPPNAAKATTVPDRISGYAPDPTLNRAIEVNRRLDAMETEWLQRQWLMAMQQAPAPAPAPDYRAAGTYYPTLAFFPARRPMFVRPAVFSPAHSQPRPAQRARLNRL
jgi:hypothetical protein